MALVNAVQYITDQFQLGVNFKAKSFWAAIHFVFNSSPVSSKCI